jgi:hypothetical protein
MKVSFLLVFVGDKHPAEGQVLCEQATVNKKIVNFLVVTRVASVHVRNSNI